MKTFAEQAQDLFQSYRDKWQEIEQINQTVQELRSKKTELEKEINFLNSVITEHVVTGADIMSCRLRAIEDQEKKVSGMVSSMAVTNPGIYSATGIVTTATPSVGGAVKFSMPYSLDYNWREVDIGTGSVWVHGAGAVGASGYILHGSAVGANGPTGP